LERLKREGVGFGRGGKKGEVADREKYDTGSGSILSRILRIRVSKMWRVFEAVWTRSLREEELKDNELIGIP
jgi:hypothetical protein